MSRRGALLGAAGAAALLPAQDAEALSGFNPLKDVQDNYQVFYPTGWTEVSVDGQDVVYKDVIEPLESMSVSIAPTQRESIAEVGSKDEVAAQLVERALTSPNQQTQLVGTSERKDKNGNTYYTFEYVSQGRGYTRHGISTVTVNGGKFYTMATGASERRWKKMEKKLRLMADSFTLLY